MDFTYNYRSPLADMTLASDGENLTGVWFNRQKYFASTLDPQSENRRLPIFDMTCEWLDTYFAGKIPDFTPRLTMRGTPFRRAVWEILLTIPYGTTITYKEIASLLAHQSGRNSMSAQAVGSAVGHNPFALIIPCHRVIGTDGSLTGYAAGLDIKCQLLAHERQHFHPHS